jgi:pyruvate formate lyase activating enzyme
MDDITGTVLEIQRMSTEDGPGLRTTVFMKGCPMKCLWCHNPESISPLPQVHWIGMRCIGCLTCLLACPRAALAREENSLLIRRELCDGCGLCAEQCPSTALELLGKKWDTHALARELLKDREYFKQSGGGVTISGGEATLQWRFVAALLKILKEEGIHICIDTCGIARQEALEAILPFTDIVLFDLKEMDPELHHRYTHTDLSQVLSNLAFISQYLEAHASNAEIWIRTPIIPGATAREDNVARIGAVIAAAIAAAIAGEAARHGDGRVRRWDLLAFNNLCRDKYLRLGLDWPFKDTALMTSEAMEQLAETARRSGVDPEIVHWSGSTRLEEDEIEAISTPKPVLPCGC